MDVQTNQTIREIVQGCPAAVPVFETFGIDYCCGGHRSLADACSKKNIPLSDVLSALGSAAAGRPAVDDAKWMSAPLSELTDHIVATHHVHEIHELARLTALAEKVFLRHGQNHDELGGLRDLVNAISSEMTAHMLKEELVLFPQLAKLQSQSRVNASGSLSMPIRHMMEEHEDTGELLEQVRKLTNDYQPPNTACMSYQALFHGLADLEKDLHQHIHLENNILFPRALAFETVH